MLVKQFSKSEKVDTKVFIKKQHHGIPGQT